MPSKRRAPKRAAHPITPAAVEAFRLTEATRPTYYAYLRGSTCKSTSPSRHCDTCSEYLDASRRLSGLLGLRPWEMLGSASLSRSPGTVASACEAEMAELYAALKAASDTGGEDAR